MKTYRFILILLPLLYSLNASACWDDDDDDWFDFYDDDWWYDDWDDDDDWEDYDDYDWWSSDSDDDDDWDYDGDGWDDDDDWDDWNYPDDDDDWWDDDSIWLPDVVVTPDDEDDDWWRVNWDYEEGEDEDPNDYYYDDDDGTGQSNNNTISGTNGDYKEYTIKSTDKVITMDLSQTWIKQKTTQTCVVTAMEYVANILNNSNVNFRTVFTDDYKNCINGANEMEKRGVFFSEIDRFINLEFNATQVYNQFAFSTALDYNCPILSIISSEPLRPWSLIEHMIVIIGQTSDRNYYIYIDPADGKYKTISYYTINGPNYRINYFK